MPIPKGCKPRFRFKGDVRLTFCNNKVVETKTKAEILAENDMKRRR